MPLLKQGSIEWRGQTAAAIETLTRQIDGADTAAFEGAVGREVRRRFGLLEAGVRAYQEHPYTRDVAEVPVVWQDGAVRLLDYGAAGDDGPVVLVVPSLINRAYILDLSARRSLLRWLADQGVRPLLLDWGAPGPAERGLDLSGYITQRVLPALAWAATAARGQVTVLGYCMGGLLALAAAARVPEAVSRMVLMATPWDFHGDAAAQAQGAQLQAVMAPWWPLSEALGEVLVDVIQALFSVGDPMQVPQKFLRFAEMDQGSPEAADFVALEDWLNDGVPLAVSVARDCLAGWYGENQTGRGVWHVDGVPVVPGEVKLPALVLVPRRDRIVPPASANALGAALPEAEVMSVPLGHIGMVVGGRAKVAVWQPLLDWLKRA